MQYFFSFARNQQNYWFDQEPVAPTSLDLAAQA